MMGDEILQALDAANPVIDGQALESHRFLECRLRDGFRVSEVERLGLLASRGLRRDEERTGSFFPVASGARRASMVRPCASLPRGVGRGRVLAGASGMAAGGFPRRLESCSSSIPRTSTAAPPINQTCPAKKPGCLGMFCCARTEFESGLWRLYLRVSVVDAVEAGVSG